MKRTKARAVALQYQGQSIPKVTAKGEGRVAKQIVAAAKANGIPIEKNQELTALLSSVRIHDDIPPQLYTAVAQILAFLYHLNGKKPGDNKIGKS